MRVLQDVLAPNPQPARDRVIVDVLHRHLQRHPHALAVGAAGGGLLLHLADRRAFDPVPLGGRNQVEDVPPGARQRGRAPSAGSGVWARGGPSAGGGGGSDGDWGSTDMSSSSSGSRPIEPEPPFSSDLCVTFITGGSWEGCQPPPAAAAACGPFTARHGRQVATFATFVFVTRDCHSAAQSFFLLHKTAASGLTVECSRASDPLALAAVMSVAPTGHSRLLAQA